MSRAADLTQRLASALTDRYRLERELGEGGMAIVHLAEDVKHHRRVAIKVLRPELAASLGTERFLREIQIAARLHHPHILSLYDSGGDGDLLYFVMPFVEGQSLRERIARGGALPIDEAVRIIREVADALEYSHSQGVVHRDIKPENVLISGSHALVTDFGVAKAVSDAGGRGSLTATGVAVGTPAYMAPEQVTADPAQDHRVDIYALGVLAYEILAGRAPFLGATLQQVIAGHLTQQPESLRLHRASVTPELESIVMRCLEKSAADRWRSAGELARALESLGASGGERAHGGASAHGAVAAGPLRRGRRRALLAIAAVASVAVVSAAAWFGKVGRAGTLIGDGALAEDDLVLVAEFANGTGDSTLAATVTDAVRVDLQQSRAVRVMTQAAMWAGMARMSLPRGAVLPAEQVQELAEREGAKAFVLGDITRVGGGYQITARVVATQGGNEELTARATARDESELIGAIGDVGRQLRREIGESLRDVLGAPRLAEVTTTSLPALRVYTAAARAENEGMRAQAVDLALEALRIDSTFAAVWGLLYVSYSNLGRTAQATDAIARLYALRDRLSEVERLRAEARYFASRSDIARAEAAWRGLVALGRDHANLANVLLAQSRFAEAEAVGRQAIGPTVRQGVPYYNLIEAQAAQSRFAAAESSLAVFKERLPTAQLRFSAELNLMLARHDYDAAARFLDAPEHATFAQGPSYRCLLDYMRGRFAAANACPAPIFWLTHPLTRLATFRLTGDSAQASLFVAGFLSKPLSERDPDGFAAAIAMLADLGRVAEARTLLDQWRARASGRDPNFAADSGLAVGSIAAAEQRWPAAVDAFLAWNRATRPSSIHNFNQGWPEAAAVLQRMGLPDSARVLYERAIATPGLSVGSAYELAWYARALAALGEIHEGRGDRAKAAEYYRKYLDLYAAPDASLRSAVASVRARYVRVTAEPTAR